MPRPFTRSALESLGKRLVAADSPSSTNVQQLQELLAAYDAVLVDAVERVSAELEVAPGARIKSTTSIIDKLRRNGGCGVSEFASERSHFLTRRWVIVRGGVLLGKG